MIKDALKFIVDSANQPYQIGDYFFTKDKWEPVEMPRVETLQVSSLDGFIKVTQQAKNKKGIFVHIEAKSMRVVASDLTYGYRREVYVEYKAGHTFEQNLIDRVKKELKDFTVVQ